MSKITALYSRVSTDMQRDKGFSIPRQKEWLESSAQQRGFSNIQHFVDDGFSASSANRPAYQRLLSKIKEGVIGTVIVYKFDRIARNVIELLGLVDLLKKKNINFISSSENLDTTTPHGMLMLTILGSLAEWERSVTVERVKDAMYDKAEKGDFCGGQPPYGFDVKDKNLVVNKDEAGWVKRMFNKFEETRSFRKVCISLNDKGVLTKRGQSWAASTVRRILTSHVYKGFYTYGKRAGGSKVYLPEDKWLIIKGHYEPIISEEQFDRVQALIKQRVFTKPKRSGVVYLLSGLLRCGECGGSLCGHTQIKIKTGQKYSGYRCHHHLSKGEKICKGVRINKNKLEQSVLQEIRKTAKIHFEESEADEVLAKDIDCPVDDLKQIEGSISRVKNKQQKLLMLFEDDAVSRDLLLERMKKISNELEQFQIQKANLIIETNPKEKNKRLSLLQKIKEANGDFLSYTDDVKKTILQQLIKKITVSKEGGIEIELYEL